jgi:hypothetical protein
MPGSISAEPLLKVRDGTRPGQLESHRGHAEVHHVAVRVDQAGQEGSALAVDHMLEHLRRRRSGQDALHLAVVADQQAGEVLQRAVGANLHAVDVADEGLGGRLLGREQRAGEEEGGFGHYGRIALFGRP